MKHIANAQADLYAQRQHQQTGEPRQTMAFEQASSSS
jgi:hypothetical protein